jgi:hypothetical protein
MTLWRPCLFRAFPHTRGSRTQVHQPLDYLRTFRNRIAHHAPIFTRHLEADYASILAVAGWICPKTRDWIEPLARPGPARAQLLGHAARDRRGDPGRQRSPLADGQHDRLGVPYQRPGRRAGGRPLASHRLGLPGFDQHAIRLRRRFGVERDHRQRARGRRWRRRLPAPAAGRDVRGDDRVRPAFLFCKWQAPPHRWHGSAARHRRAEGRCRQPQLARGAEVGGRPPPPAPRACSAPPTPSTTTGSRSIRRPGRRGRRPGWMRCRLGWRWRRDGRKG